jgi:thiaminase/transcriptional activator TenA
MSDRQPFTKRLRQLAEPIWDAQYNHSFIQGIGRGTIDLNCLKYWVRQDYLFLVEYARLLSLAAARSPDLETMTRFTKLAFSTLGTEMELHRSYARDFGISLLELETESKAPTCQAYTDFLLRTAALGGFTELVAALLPCMWGFSELGKRLAADGLPQEEGCARWIQMYADPEFADLAEWCCYLVDAVAKNQPSEELARMETAFLTSTRFEYAFWEMAWQMENWLVP